MKKIFCLTFLTIFFVVSAFADSSLTHKYRNMDIAKHGYKVLATSNSNYTLVSDKNGNFLFYDESPSINQINIFRQSGQVTKDYVVSKIREEGADKILEHNGYTVYGIGVVFWIYKYYFVKTPNGKFYSVSVKDNIIDAYEEEMIKKL